MSRRRIIILVVIILLLVGAGVGIATFLSYKDVSFLFKYQDMAIDIYSRSGLKVTSLSHNDVVKLKEGSYYYKTTVQKYDSANIYFEVKDKETVEVSPSYSSDYLAKLLDSQRDTIHAALIARFSSLSDNYIIGDESLAHYGEWYSAKLIKRVSGGNQPDVYRVVLYNDTTSWKIVAGPLLILSIQDFPSVPAYIIRNVNAPLSNGAYALLYPE